MHKDSILTIVRSGQSVFRTSDLALLWNIEDRDYLKNKIYRLVKNGKLIRIRSGLFTWSQNYDSFLEANKIVSPSYVSLQTILAPAGAHFQYESSIYSIATISIEKKVQGTRFIYRKIRDDIFFQKKGIVLKGYASMATQERAFLDWLYLNPFLSLDNINILDRETCFNLVPIYQNQALERRLKKCFKE
jgi:hypothetical protein